MHEGVWVLQMRVDRNKIRVDGSRPFVDRVSYRVGQCGIFDVKCRRCRKPNDPKVHIAGVNLCQKISLDRQFISSSAERRSPEVRRIFGVPVSNALARVVVERMEDDHVQARARQPRHPVVDR